MPRFRSRRRPVEAPLAVQPGSTVKRDVYRAATAGVTGITAFGALAVTGAVAGTAAHDQALKQAGPATQPAPPATQVVTKRRPHRTIVRTRVVHAVSGPSVTRPATGGTVSSSSSSHSSGSTGHSAPKPAAPPPPKPAPSSGS